MLQADEFGNAAWLVAFGQRDGKLDVVLFGLAQVHLGLRVGVKYLLMMHFVLLRWVTA